MILRDLPMNFMEVLGKNNMPYYVCIVIRDAIIPDEINVSINVANQVIVGTVASENLLALKEHLSVKSLQIDKKLKKYCN